jgi:hypothetical protein
MNEIEVPIKITGIGAIKKELRDLKGEIANATDSEQIRKLSQRAGELKDQLADANEQVNIFASGSKFEQVNNGLSSIKDSIMSLDFAEAGDKAQILTNALKGINPADFAEQFKGFGKILGSLGSTIGILAKQFISFGVSLLANPIFLLVAVITAIVAAILIFLNKIGVLKKVIDTLMAPVKALIQGFKDLTDWLGLTSFAAEENAAKMEAANERVMESSKKRQEAVVGGFEYEIKMAKIYGQDTLDLELGKSKAIGTEAKKRLSSAEKALDAQRALGDKANKETIKKLKTQIDDEKKLIIEQRRERNLLVAQDAVDKREEAKKDLEEDKKNNEAKRKARNDANKKAIDDAKKFAADRLAAQRTIRDIEIALIKEDSDREIVATQEKYARLIEDTIKNENLTKDEKIKLQQLYQKQLEAELGKQEQVELDAEKAKQQKLNDQIKANQEAELQAQEDFYEQYRLQVMSAQEKEVDAVNGKYFQLIAKAEQQRLDTKILKEQQEKELADINKKYADQQAKDSAEAEKKKRDAQLETANNALQIAESSTKAIQAVGDIAFAAKMSKVKKGSKEEEELAKKQFKFNKALQLAGAVVDAGKAITASLAAAPLAVGLVPNPVGIANLVATAAVSAANIAKIASTQFNSGGGGGGQAPSIPQASSTSTTAASPNVSLFGGQAGGNGLNDVSAPKEPQTQITVKAVVSETEITNTQQKIDKINQNATL